MEKVKAEVEIIGDLEELKWSLQQEIDGVIDTAEVENGTRISKINILSSRKIKENENQIDDAGNYLVRIKSFESSENNVTIIKHVSSDELRMEQNVKVRIIDNKEFNLLNEATKKLKLSEEFMKKYWDKIGNKADNIKWIAQHCIFSQEFLEDYLMKSDIERMYLFGLVLRNKNKIRLSEEFIENNLEDISNYTLIRYCETGYLSDEFILNHLNKFNSKVYSQNEENISFKVIDTMIEQKMNIDWYVLSNYKKLPFWFILKYFTKLYITPIMLIKKEQHSVISFLSSISALTDSEIRDSILKEIDKFQQIYDYEPDKKVFLNNDFWINRIKNNGDAEEYNNDDIRYFSKNIKISQSCLLRLAKEHFPLDWDLVFKYQDVENIKDELKELLK